MKALKLKNINLDWNLVQQDLDHYKTDSKFTNSIVEDYDHSRKWKDSLREETKRYLEYGYTQHNTKIWKSTNGFDTLEFAWQDQLKSQLPLDNSIVTLTRQDPGQVLPWHQDKFYMLRKLYPNDNRSIYRILVFFEDWKLGHLLQIHNEMLYNWKQGDAWIWPVGTGHVAANVGLEPKWTCNITGFLTDLELEVQLQTL